MKTRLFILWIHCLLLSAGARAQYGSTIGSQAVSTLAWEQISTGAGTDLRSTIGLTTDGRVYTWGENAGFPIHTQFSSGANYAKSQTVPFYVPFPAGEVIVKVACTTNVGTSFPTFFALSQSGKMYAWGANNGMLATAWLPQLPAGTTVAVSDTTKTKRQPVQLTIMGESDFVDFDVPPAASHWIAIGASGKAYHNGQANDLAGGFPQTTYAELPKPAGVDVATFKYSRVWVDDLSISPGASSLTTYLKGNDGKIYFTGSYNHFYSWSSGVPFITNTNVPAVLNSTTPWSSNPAAERGQIRVLVPVEVPFPAGEDIVDMKVQTLLSRFSVHYALSASGKAYTAGIWKRFPTASSFQTNSTNTYLTVPLKSVPPASDLLKVRLGDSLYVLNKFTEIAMPPGATKIIDLTFYDEGSYNGALVLTDTKKAYWSGVLRSNDGFYNAAGNFLSLSFSYDVGLDRCLDLGSTQYVKALTSYSWSAEAINYSGARKIINATGTSVEISFFLIDHSNRGYYLGRIYAGSGLGKLGNNRSTLMFPVPIANEQLLDCQTSPGTGGPLTGPVTPTNTAVGTIDCSKTQIAPAPVAGTPSQTTLIVSVNVTTAGTFTPITVSGSGMSLGNGITSVSTASTGVKTFYIPIQYDGSALTNALQFTIGSAGSCTADLTKTPVKAITDVWTLECLPSVGPALKK